MDAISQWRKWNPLVQMDKSVCSIVLRVGTRIVEHPFTCVVFFMTAVWRTIKYKMGILFLSHVDLNISNKNVCITVLLCELIDRFSKFTP